MKTKTLNYIVCALVATMPLCSCQKEFKYKHAGDEVRFAIGSGSAETKAVYSGKTNGDKSIERIDWEENDLIRIYSAQVSAPTDKFADYAVTSVDIPESGSVISTADIAAYGGEGLHWGTGTHTFYGVYPSPKEEGSLTVSIGTYDDGGTKGSVSKSIEGSIVTAKLPAKQAVASLTGSGTLSCVAAPDLKNMLMTAKSEEYDPETGIPDGVVFLSFTPLTTAVQFTITNQTKAPLVLKSVSLTSAANPLNGPFSVNIDNAGTPASIDLDDDGSTTGANDIKYSRAYPECTYTGGAATDATRTVTINFTSPVTLAYDADPAKSGKLTFTFFLQPCQNFNDLTFKLVKSDDSWMSTKLGYTDGSGVLFPRFKKTTVKGIMVPEGARWTVKYGPSVEPWNQSSTDIDPMPEVNEGLTVVTSWDTENGGNLVLD